MITDVAGRVRNVQLPGSRPLLPLFEAISNSIDAIEDAGEKDGRITIEVIRDKNTLFSAATSSSERQLADVIGFIIHDNGIGFDESNFTEFNKADTTHKATRGGKGIGRFMWLVAFERVEIESVFRENGVNKCRQFVFALESTGIINHSCETTTKETRGTRIELKNYKDRYRKQCPKRLDTIAAFIVEEFLDVFISPACPKMKLCDPLAELEINLDDFFETEMVAHSEIRNIKLKEETFEILHVRLYSTHIREHRLYMCARDRVVTKEKLTGIPNLAPRLLGDDGKEFVYAAYVSSKYLNDLVTPDRTGFNLSEEDSGIIEEEITINDIRKAVKEHCREYLTPYTEPVKAKKRERLNQFIQDEGAMYRPILRHLEHKLDEIVVEATNDEIDQHLYEAYHELQVALRREGQDLLQTAVSPGVEFDKYRERLDEYFTRVTEVNKADLARYVCHRKLIIKFLRRILSLQPDGRYLPEERIHQLIFPRAHTSDEVLFEEHNLWLIDERLAFHVFLSSDKSIRQAPPLQNESRKEPDILLFDKAFAFSEVQNVPFSSVTIIEFKKPQRNEYTDKENPFTQIADYIRDIKEGKAKLADGRDFPIPANLPFYCYVVCDITPRLRNWAENFELETTPDGLGYYGYKRHLNAYCEVVSYSKLVSDAEKRNQAFFYKLGMPK